MPGFQKSKKPFRLGLKLKLIIVICFLLSALVLIIGISINRMVADILEDQIGKRALSVARSVSLIPEIRAAFDEDNPSEIIQPLVEPMRVATGAEFIVIGNTETVRYSHPVSERIGKTMVGDDNDPALEDGIFYTSRAVGTLGPSLRGKGPIFSDDGEIIGIVSVGFLIDDIETIIGRYEQEIWFLVLLFIGIGTLGATLIGSHFKKMILGLEPEEITHLFIQKEAILQSIHEGVIAINQDGNITMINNSAQKILGGDTEQYINKPIKEVLPNTKMIEVLESGQSQFDQETTIGQKFIIANRMPIMFNDQVIGVVASFRDKTEIDRLTEELHRIKIYTEALRAQTHEFSNKLYTISGLLQLGQFDEAVKLINKEQKVQQEWIRYIIREIKDPMISAILLGKFNRASELGVKITIDQESSLSYIGTDEERETLITVIGNIIENSIEASLENNDHKPEVNISIVDLGNDIIIDVSDSGNGIPVDDTDKIFENGFSTKAANHRGIGLFLAKQALNNLNGAITVEKGELGGACFTIYIPKSTGELHYAEA